MFVLHIYIVQRVLEKKTLMFATGLISLPDSRFFVFVFVRKSGSTSVARAFASLSLTFAICRCAAKGLQIVRTFDNFTSAIFS